MHKINGVRQMTIFIISFPNASGDEKDNKTQDRNIVQCKTN